MATAERLLDANRQPMIPEGEEIFIAASFKIVFNASDCEADWSREKGRRS